MFKNLWTLFHSAMDRKSFSYIFRKYFEMHHWITRYPIDIISQNAFFVEAPLEKF